MKECRHATGPIQLDRWLIPALLGLAAALPGPAGWAAPLALIDPNCVRALRNNPATEIKTQVQEFLLDRPTPNIYRVYKVTMHAFPDDPGTLEIHTTEMRTGTPPDSLTKGGLTRRTDSINEFREEVDSTYDTREKFNSDVRTTLYGYFELFADQSTYLVHRTNGKIDGIMRLITVQYEKTFTKGDGETTRLLGQSKVAEETRDALRKFPGWEKLGPRLPEEVYLDIQLLDPVGAIKKTAGTGDRITATGRGAKVEPGAFIVRQGSDPVVFTRLYTTMLRTALDLADGSSGSVVFNTWGDEAGRRMYRRLGFRPAKYRKADGTVTSDPVDKGGIFWQPLEADIPALRKTLERLGDIRRQLTPDELEETYDLFQALTGIDMRAEKMGIPYLTEPQREAYRLAEVEGMAQNAAAKAMDIHPVTFQRLLAAAKRVIESPANQKLEAAEPGTGSQIGQTQFRRYMRWMTTQPQLQDRLNMAYNLLPESQRRLLQAVYFEGKTRDEVAAESGLKRTTVDSLLADGIHSARNLLGEDGELLPPREGDPKFLIRYLKYKYPEQFPGWLKAIPLRLQKPLELHDIEEQPTSEIEVSGASSLNSTYRILTSGRAHLLAEAQKAGVELPPFAGKGSRIGFLKFLEEAKPGTLGKIIDTHDLSEKQWQAAKLYFVDGLNRDAIAEQLGATKVTITGHLGRVVPLIEKELAADGTATLSEGGDVELAGVGTEFYGGMDVNDLQELAQLGESAMAAMKQAASELPETQRKYAEPFFVGGKTRSEIAKDFQVAEQTVTLNLRSAATLLRQRISRGGDLVPFQREASVDEQLRRQAKDDATKARFEDLVSRMMSTRQRVVRLFYQEGKSVREISAITGLTAKAIFPNIWSSRQILLDALNSGGQEVIVVPKDTSIEFDKRVRAIVQRDPQKAKDLLADMTPEQKNIADLYYFQGKSQPQINAIRGTSKNATAQNLKYIRIKLARRLELQEEDPTPEASAAEESQSGAQEQSPTQFAITLYREAALNHPEEIKAAIARLSGDKKRWIARLYIIDRRGTDEIAHEVGNTPSTVMSRLWEISHDLSQIVTPAGVPIEAPTLDDRLETFAQDEKTKAQFEAALKSLPNRQAEVARLFFIKGLDRKEISGETGLSQENVKSYVVKSRTALREELKAQGVEGFAHEEQNYRTIDRNFRSRLPKDKAGAKKLFDSLNLSPQQRAVAEAYYLRNKTIADIARELGIGEGTVGVHMRSARAKIAKKFPDQK